MQMHTYNEPLSMQTLDKACIFIFISFMCVDVALMHNLNAKYVMCTYVYVCRYSEVDAM